MISDKLYLEEHGEELLKELGMTKAEFARRMGIHKQNVNSVLATKHIEIIRKIAEVLNVPFELLISYSKEPDYDGCTFYSDFVPQARYIRVILPYDKGDELFTIRNAYGENLSEFDFEDLPVYDEENKQFDFTINLSDSKICDWNEVIGYRIWAKVCNSGTYILLDENKEPLLQIAGYVPEGVIPPLDHCWGDYVEFCISDDGTVTNWPENPDLMIFASEGTLPKPIKSNKWGRARLVLYKIKMEKLTKEELEWIKNQL